MENTQLKNYVLNSTKPGALYSLSRLKKVEGLNFSPDQLQHFYRENDALRQFYGVRNIPKRKIVRNGYACFPLERVHIDLCEMTKQQGKSEYKYILFAVDNFSRYVFYVLLKSKKSQQMETAAQDLLAQMKPYRKLSFNQRTVFMSDLGTEFITTFKNVLDQNNHTFVNLATSESKAFYAERFIRTFRTLLKVKQTSLDLQGKDYEDWTSILPDVIKTYNNTPHKSLGFKAPYQFITLQANAVQQSNRSKPDVSKQAFLKTLKNYEEKRPFRLGDYVNITLTRKNIFSKGSEQTKIGLEIFKIAKIRPPILNAAKLAYYFLEDLTGKLITGGFYENNLVLIPPSSRRHPLNARFKKTVARVVTSNPSKKTYRVTYSGNARSFFIIQFSLTCSRFHRRSSLARVSHSNKLQKNDPVHLQKK